MNNNLSREGEAGRQQATIEHLAARLYVSENGPWVSGQGLTPGGTPWGTTRERERRNEYLRRAREWHVADQAEAGSKP